MGEAPQIPQTLLAKLDELSSRFEALGAELEDPAVAADFRRVRDLGAKRAALEPFHADSVELRRAMNDVAELETALAGGDPELAELANAELPAARTRIEQAVRRATERLVHADDDAVASIVMEIRAGVGGDEAALWAGDILEMYTRFAAQRSWRVETMEIGEGQGGGVRAATLSISGPGVFAALAHEAGTHCVKRVPATETQGRIHTSTATVAVLPEPEEVQLRLDPADVEEHVTTAQGPGGQNVNKVATAVHLVHRPTGVEVRMQETKSQKQNREKAWRLLRARLYERQLAEQAAARQAERAAQIGGAGRAERIRTYRFKDAIAVDHRLGESFSLEGLLAGDLEELVKRLRAWETERRLQAL